MIALQEMVRLYQYGGLLRTVFLLDPAISFDMICVSRSHGLADRHMDIKGMVPIIIMKMWPRSNPDIAHLGPLKLNNDIMIYYHIL